MEWKLIEGGKKTKEECERKLISGFLSDTRLMGVVGVYLRWEILDCDEAQELHQLFSLDHEEFGIESYLSFWDGSKNDIAESFDSMIGSLGGENKNISEREARYLLNEYAQINKENNNPLPGEVGEYRDLLENPPMLSTDEIFVLYKKQCTELVSDCQVINYFLMRCLGKDYSAATYLTNGRVDVYTFANDRVTALCRNRIEPTGIPGRYCCHSLVEAGSRYHIYVSEVEVEDLLISNYSLVSEMDISEREAALALARSEFVTVYRIEEGMQNYVDIRSDIPKSSVMTAYENGRMFMIFKDTNDHVNNPVFLLNGDVYGVAFVSEGGQLIISSFEERCIAEMERLLARGENAVLLTATGRYVFQEPILIDFIHSEFDLFEDFMEVLQLHT